MCLFFGKAEYFSQSVFSYCSNSTDWTSAPVNVMAIPFKTTIWDHPQMVKLYSQNRICQEIIQIPCPHLLVAVIDEPSDLGSVDVSSVNRKCSENRQEDPLPLGWCGRSRLWERASTQQTGQHQCALQQEEMTMRMWSPARWALPRGISWANPGGSGWLQVQEETWNACPSLWPKMRDTITPSRKKDK